MSKIDETLKKIAADTSKANSPTSSSTDQPPYSPAQDMPGDPNCPYCGGRGYLHQDLPVGHPDFGKLLICSCRQDEIRQRIHQRLFAFNNLEKLHQLTFETFQPRGHVGLPPKQADSLEAALNHSRQFAQSQDGWLLLQGGYGCGKTHLAAAIANFAVSMGVPTLFITVPDMLDALRFAYSDPEADFEDRFDEIRNSPLLILDDFGTQNATPWAQEKLFQILNYRYINQLPLVITTNLLLSEIEERIRSRLLDPQLVTQVYITAPDYRNPGDDTGSPTLSSVSVLRKYTFATFDLRKGEGLPKNEVESLEKAFRAAREFAERPQGWLILTGDSFCGKTHLAAAIYNYRIDLGFTPYFADVTELMDHLRAAFSPDSTVSLDRRFEEVRTASLLIMDDLGAQSMTPWVREKLHQLFDYRYKAELPTVITSVYDLKKQLQEKIDPRLLNRMVDPRLCKIHAILVPAYRRSQMPKTQERSRRKGSGST